MDIKKLNELYGNKNDYKKSEVLEIFNNKDIKLDLSKMENLKTLTIESNSNIIIEKLPPSIEEIYIQCNSVDLNILMLNNRIKVLNVESIDNSIIHSPKSFLIKNGSKVKVSKNIEFTDFNDSFIDFFNRETDYIYNEKYIKNKNFQKELDEDLQFLYKYCIGSRYGEYKKVKLNCKHKRIPHILSIANIDKIQVSDITYNNNTYWNIWPINFKEIYTDSTSYIYIPNNIKNKLLYNIKEYRLFNSRIMSDVSNNIKIDNYLKLLPMFNKNSSSGAYFLFILNKKFKEEIVHKMEIYKVKNRDINV